MYKHFKPNEYISLSPELMDMLDRAREIAGVPFIITSGWRSKEKNAAVGGAENSAHLTGEAADLKCDSSPVRLEIISALIAVGFTRIGIGKTHIHVDISETLPQNVLFLEY